MGKDWHEGFGLAAAPPHNVRLGMKENNQKNGKASSYSIIEGMIRQTMNIPLAKDEKNQFLNASKPTTYEKKEKKFKK